MSRQSACDRQVSRFHLRYPSHPSPPPRSASTQLALVLALADPQPQPSLSAPSTSSENKAFHYPHLYTNTPPQIPPPASPLTSCSPSNPTHKHSLNPCLPPHPHLR